MTVFNLPDVTEPKASLVVTDTLYFVPGDKPVTVLDNSTLVAGTLTFLGTVPLEK